MSEISEQRKELRADLTTEVEFRIENEVMTAQTIDVSYSGFRLETSQPLTISLTFKEDIIPNKYTAELVWARETGDGMMEYGFRYLKDGEPEQEVLIFKEEKKE
ncbi:MAG: PilZ domain-containing protein [Myxococcota bacterium]|nr:PilZ domain-containing protein [Myxococcota bacterium]